MSETLRDIIKRHHFDLREDIRYHDGREPDTTMVLMPETTWGDYVGDDCQRSNLRVLVKELRETWGDLEGEAWEVRYYGYGAEMLWVDGALEVEDVDYHSDDTMAGHLARALVSLRENSPLLDEDDHSALEVEVTDECWESYGRQDFKRDLDRDWDDDVSAYFEDDEIDAAVHEAWSLADQGPYFESAISIIFPDVLEDVRDALIALYASREAPQGETLPLEV